ncbi:NAD(P)/FAD-dependent oxidoreductase [Paenibacillus sp. CC-CFT747]|nr:NAD(P)/FAD-dependent oxidoreductase [Paenibacillus sp. CC-CFT747]
MQYDCIIVGGGIAGLQAAVQLGRYTKHKVLVIDSGYGRSTLCRRYHNVLGWPDGVSGEQLRETGRKQAGSLGVQFAEDTVVSASREDTGFSLAGRSGGAYSARTLLLATGLLDRFPELPGLVPCFGRTVYVCPDCDSFEVRHRRTVVLGAGDVGANMAFTLSERTSELTYINHDGTTVSEEALGRLKELGIGYREEPISRIETKGDGEITAAVLESGERIEAERGFIAFGGNEVKSELAKQLGVERLENKHVPADPRTKMTNVPNVWVAGDLGVHAEQLTIAMGEGALAAIWIHKTLCQMDGQ